MPRIAFESLLPYVRDGFRLAFGLLLNAEDAEDVVQEALMRAHRSISTHEILSVRLWFLGIVRNEALRLYKMRYKTNPEPIEDEMPDLAPSSYDAVARTFQQEAIQEALQGLSLAYREVIVLKHFEGFSYQEIADFVGVPIGTVMSRLARSRALLSKELTRREVYP